MPFNEQQSRAMQRALQLALNGPIKGVNPRVGAVLINNAGQVVAEGWHMGAGTDHAEVAALKDLQTKTLATSSGTHLAHGLTAVLTLEPCNHTGRTGPCTAALIEAGVSKVIFATEDPGVNSGGGASALREAGIAVEFGLLRAEAEELIRVWATATHQQRPFVTLKYGTSLDGRNAAADGSSRWITGPEARQDAHLRRSQVDAILIGTKTVVVDNPELTARQPDGQLYAEQPIRVILGETEIASSARIFNKSNGEGETLQLRTHDLNSALLNLFNLGIRHLMVEGGAMVASEFARKNLVNEYLIYLAPKLIGGQITSLGDLGVANISQAKNLKFVEVRQLGADLLIRATERNG